MTAPTISQPGTLADRLKAQMVAAVQAWEDSRPRSRQAGIGASDLGHPCLRHVAYRATGAPRGPGTDPWPAIVGTSCHEWVLTQAFRPDPQTWALGTSMEIGPGIRGTLDLYHRPSRTVIDHKVLGVDAMRDLRLRGPKPAYRTQIHCYAFGLLRGGEDPEHVAIAGWPRSGWMKDLFVWVEPFDLDVVEVAFQRWYTLVDAAPALTPELFTALATDASGCFFCPYRNRALAATNPELACPGVDKK